MSDDKDDEQAEIIHFKTLKERDKARREQAEKDARAQKEKEEKWRREYQTRKVNISGANGHGINGASNDVPFFNFGRLPTFTKYFVGTLLLIHIILQFFVSDVMRLQVYALFGFIPAYYTLEIGWWSLFGPLTHSLLHSSWMHIGFNSVMLLALGKFFETEFGLKRMMTLFVICLLGGAALHFVFNPTSSVPVIGASGGASGLFGVMLMRFYQKGMMGALGKRGPLALILIWLFLLMIMGIFGGPNTAWLAHLGGFLSGLIYFSWIQRRSLKFWKI